MQIKKTVCLLLCLTMLAGMLAGCGNKEPTNTEGSVQSTVTPVGSTHGAEAQSPLFSDVRIVVDGIVYETDIYVQNGAWCLAAEDMTEIFGGSFDGAYVPLDAYAQRANISYTQDEVLTAAYFCTWEPYAEVASIGGFEPYAAELGLPLEKLEQETVSGAEMAELLDCFVTHEAPEQVESWKEISQDLRGSASPLCRSDALAALFLAAWQVNGVYMDYEKESSMDLRDAAFDKSDDNRNWDLFNHAPIPSGFDVGYGFTDHYGAASCIFNIGTVSPVDGSYPFSFDGVSFHHDENAAYLDAVLAISRLYSIKDVTTVSIDDPAAVSLNNIFTDALLDKAKAPSNVTADNHPQWTGFALDGGYDDKLNECITALSNCANWGFNSARLYLSYEQIFNRDVTEANLANLNTLDRLVAEAVKYNMHLNIQLTSLPGRWQSPSGEFEKAGEFDLFLNKEKQEQAKRVFAVLAQRYSGISNDYLSFAPTFEMLNQNLSTGNPCEPYTLEDCLPVVSELVDVIREKDPARLIIIEPTPGRGDMKKTTEAISAVLSDRENILYSYNYCSDPFVYACMTAESGRDIDDENQSYYLQTYPTYFYELDNVIVDPEKKELEEWMPEGFFADSSSLMIDGCLPAGTTIDLYIQQTYGGQLQFIADGEIVYTEDLNHIGYNKGETISGYISYAVTDKKVSVTLTQDTALLEIATPGGALWWTGMDLWLPEEYATERWYYATPYDVYRGLEAQEGIILKKEARVMVWPYGLADNNEGYKENRLTIHKDLTFSTPRIHNSSTKESILQDASVIAGIEHGGILRHERALFNGGIWEEIQDYYEDMYDAFNTYEISWWSSDWFVLTNDTSTTMAEVRQVEYDSYSCFNLELLKLVQKYQNSERP